MRRFLAALLVFLLVANPSSAIAEDEQWPLPNEFGLGHHSIVVEETTGFNQLFPSLFTWDGPNGKQLACESLDDSNCAKAGSIQFFANYAPCESAAQFDCVEDLRIETSSGSAVAEFVRYVYTEHPNAFKGDNKLLPSEIGSPSVWRIPDAPHAAGDLYLLIAGQQGAIRSGRIGDLKIYTQLVPVTERRGMWNGQIDGNGFGVIAQCIEVPLDGGLTEVKGCGAGAYDFGQYRCAIWEQDGTCLLKKAHRLGDSISITLRLKNEPTGWLHGRIENPVVESKTQSGLKTLKVAAKPVRVPILYHGANYSEMPQELKTYWDQCMKTPDCPAWTRVANSDPKNQQDGNQRNVQAYEEPFGNRVIRAVTTFAKFVNDTPVSAPTSWGFKTLDLNQNSSVTRCVSRSTGTLGVVTTNATAYSEGPPELINGSLRYSVAGLHYQTDGKTLSLGTYDLLMRSDFARCIYGFSNAPLQAAISVVTIDGENVVATTQVSERNGWLKLAAYGFTFSEKEVRVTLTQAPQPQKVSANLAKFSGKVTKLSSLQRSAIDYLMSQTEANSVATCTAYYVKASEKSLATARAKAACAYAKSLNPNLRYTTSVKQIKTASLNGRVAISSN
jgi:hypothetical protein